MQRAWAWKKLCSKAAFSLGGWGSLWRQRPGLHLFDALHSNLNVPGIFSTENFIARQRSCIDGSERPSCRKLQEEVSPEKGGVEGKRVPSQLALLCEFGDCPRAQETLFSVHPRIAVTQGW